MSIFIPTILICSCSNCKNHELLCELLFNVYILKESVFDCCFFLPFAGSPRQKFAQLQRFDKGTPSPQSFRWLIAPEI